MASNNSVLFVNTLPGEKVVYLPPASTVPGRILYIKDLCGNSAPSSIYISTAAGDSIDYKANTLYAKLSTSSGLVRLASNGSNNWMVLSHYTTAIGQPPYIPYVPPPPGPSWFSNIDGDGTVTDNGGGNWYVQGPNDGGGNGWSYIYAQFASAGSFTYNYSYTSFDGPGYDWLFDDVSSSDLSNPGNVNFGNQVTTSSGASGSRTLSYAAGQWVAIGIYSSDSCCGVAFVSLSGIPY